MKRLLWLAYCKMHGICAKCGTFRRRGESPYGGAWIDDCAKCGKPTPRRRWLYEWLRP